MKFIFDLQRFDVDIGGQRLVSYNRDYSPYHEFFYYFYGIYGEFPGNVPANTQVDGKKISYSKLWSTGSPTPTEIKLGIDNITAYYVWVSHQYSYYHEQYGNDVMKLWTYTYLNVLTNDLNKMKQISNYNGITAPVIQGGTTFFSYVGYHQDSNKTYLGSGSELIYSNYKTWTDNLPNNIKSAFSSWNTNSLVTFFFDYANTYSNKISGSFTNNFGIEFYYRVNKTYSAPGNVVNYVTKRNKRRQPKAA